MEIKSFKVSNGLFLINQCYLVYKNNLGILIDPAWDFDLINGFLIEKKITLKGIILTHSHYDHTNLADKFSKQNNVPVFMSEIEIDEYKFTSSNLKKIKHLDVLKIGDIDVIVIFTPGHTLGSVCYLINNNLFSGDTVFIEGVGMCVGQGSSASDLFDSVNLLKDYLHANTLIWPGHSYGQQPGKTFEFVLKNNIYFQFEKKEQFVSFRNRKNQSNLFNFS